MKRLGLARKSVSQEVRKSGSRKVRKSGSPKEGLTIIGSAAYNLSLS